MDEDLIDLLNRDPCLTTAEALDLKRRLDTGKKPGKRNRHPDETLENVAETRCESVRS